MTHSEYVPIASPTIQSIVRIFQTVLL